MAMIERMARAIDDAYNVNPAGDITNLDDVARVVLKAMREPSPAMVDAFVSRALQVRLGGDYRWSDYARDQWHQMIDAALADAPQDHSTT